MINLRKGNTEIIYFTGTENITLPSPYFLFIFTSSNADKVKVMCTNTSTTERFDKSSVVVNTYFTDKPEGLWRYEVREKADNTDMSVTGTVVEQGYMYLRPATDFAPTQYSGQTNDFKTYAGQ